MMAKRPDLRPTVQEIIREFDNNLKGLAVQVIKHDGKVQRNRSVDKFHLEQNNTSDTNENNTHNEDNFESDKIRKNKFSEVSYFGTKQSKLLTANAKQRPVSVISRFHTAFDKNLFPLQHVHQKRKLVPFLVDQKTVQSNRDKQLKSNFKLDQMEFSINDKFSNTENNLKEKVSEIGNNVDKA